jgi:nucleoside-diphosphate-sugar epimerase
MTDKISCYVTGSTGFVGKNLLKYFDSNSINAIPLSIRSGVNSSDFTSNSALIHLAGKAHVIEKKSNLLQSSYDQVNYILTQRLFDAFLASNVEKFIFISSIKAIADFPEGVVEEDTFPNPKTAYGISKLKAEKYLLSIKLPPSKKLYILRPCMIHGPENKGNLNLLYKIVTLGLPYPLAAFSNIRSYLSIDNLCFVIEELVRRKDIPSGVYNVADDQPVSTNRLIELFNEVLSKKQRFLKVNPRIVKWIADVGNIFRLPLNTERLRKLTENYVVSNRKLLDVIGKKMPLSAEEGLRKTIRYFKELSY